MPSYIESSSIFGSIRINRHWSGDIRYNSDRIIALTPTDFPDPVVPAIIRCGMRARSAKIGAPLISFPSASVSRPPCFCTSSDDRISDRNTVSRFAFGTSMPMTFRPDTVAIRTAVTERLRAMSSASPITRALRIPGAGSSSYSVTTGPGRISTILPCTP